jgi:hypothetical protein
MKAVLRCSHLALSKSDSAYGVLVEDKERDGFTEGIDLVIIKF